MSGQALLKICEEVRSCEGSELEDDLKCVFTRMVKGMRVINIVFYILDMTHTV